ncbi:3628_t:CDS:2 [Acaulospora morrowiae]|uniref:3628_t:CDS:1 n=1 Tax=Acaulospora morrowiae TaxID=94023 RepID=A0A9N8VCF4_9GLOM|nr:3628_t:CDS:2 [Acaulospora morrowiae]
MSETIDSKDIRVVAAIDFGTTYSGFAYVHAKNPQEIKTNTEWQDNDGRFKTPTVLLYDENMVLKEWGHPALAERPTRKKSTTGVRPVELFKLYLGSSNHKPKLPPGLYYKQAISDYLGKIGEKLKTSLKVSWPRLEFYRQVLLIFTIPAEFDSNAIGIMRECALKANLIEERDSQNLLFTTEPEAAAIHCIKTLPEHDLKTGASFMVVDCGGGTVDLTTRKLLAGGKLSEITERTGDYCGGSFVDREFLKFLGKKVGDSAIKLVEENHYGQLQYMVQEFCRRVKIPFTGNPDVYKSFELDIEDVCPVLMQYVRGEEKDKMEENKWVVIIDFSDVKAMFDPVVDRIIRLIRNQLDSCSDCSAMFLVGGFSESKYLQSRIHREFDREVENISVPTHPISAIVKGAVQFGLKQGTIVDRILKWTYGTDVCRNWLPTDPEDKKIDDKIVTFSRLAKKGTRMTVDDKVYGMYTPGSKFQSKMGLDLYITEEEDAQFCDDSGVTLLGKFSIDLPFTGDEERSVIYTLQFGMVEILATAINASTGQRYMTTFDLEF